VLSKAEELCIESVSFPVLGEEGKKVVNGVNAMIMLMAIKMYLEEHHGYISHLKLISIVIEVFPYYLY